MLLKSRACLADKGGVGGIHIMKFEDTSWFDDQDARQGGSFVCCEKCNSSMLHIEAVRVNALGNITAITAEGTKQYSGATTNLRKV
jgi:hypothetical protein